MQARTKHSCAIVGARIFFFFISSAEIPLIWIFIPFRTQLSQMNLDGIIFNHPVEKSTISLYGLLDLLTVPFLSVSPSFFLSLYLFISLCYLFSFILIFIYICAKIYLFPCSGNDCSHMSLSCRQSPK